MPTLRTKITSLLLPTLRKHPLLKALAKTSDSYYDLVRHTTATLVPHTIRPDPQEIYITLTANCNLRCVGCKYGRDFMPGAQLPFTLVRELLEDCQRFGIRSIRLYGGEPLLYKELTRVVEYAVNLGLHPWLTTNGILLKDKIDDLYAAGLRTVSIGFYGTDEQYNSYVQRAGKYEQMKRGVAYLRERYGMNIHLTIGWLLMRPTCNFDAVREMWSFAELYSAPVVVSLIHYSLPYFTEGPDGELQFRGEDRADIEEVVAELIRLKRLRPEMMRQSLMSLRSIPDWLLKGPEMKVPCDRYRLLWVGANGVVQMCYVTFVLGNLHENRLSQMLFSQKHQEAARDAFQLKCPNCHCSYPKRIESHLPSHLRYSDFMNLGH
jgi:molybdenum cofactor biosynthesis enzyme MoaA